MHFDYVDIGTSNFDTSINDIGENLNLTVLLVEPVTYYINQFEKYKFIKNLFLCNCAISDIEGFDYAYYLPEEFINIHFPTKRWLRGCNSIGSPHHLVIDELTLAKIDLNVIEKQRIEKITFDTLCRLFNIESIGRLKIDVERQEHLILPAIVKKLEQGMQINSLFIEHSPSDINFSLKEDIFRHIEKLNYTRINHQFDIELKK